MAAQSAGYGTMASDIATRQSTSQGASGPNTFFLSLATTDTKSAL